VKIGGDAPREQGFAQALIAEIDLPPHDAAMAEFAIDAIGRDVGQESRDVFSRLLAKRHHERERSTLSPDVARCHEEPQPVQLDIRRGCPGDLTVVLQQPYGIRNAGMFYRCEDPLHCDKGKLMEFSNFLWTFPISGRSPNFCGSLPPFERLLARGSQIHVVSKSLTNQIVAAPRWDHRSLDAPVFQGQVASP